MFLLALIVKIESSLSNIVNGGVMGAENAVHLKIAVDNIYSFLWNGEYNAGSGSWQQVRTYTLIPYKQCDYENVLVINAIGDRQAVDCAIFEVRYKSQLWQSGTSPEIKVALPTNPIPNWQWYMNPHSNPQEWVDSNTRPRCYTTNNNNVVSKQLEMQNTYFTNGTRWIWWTACNQLSISNVYFILVIPNVC